MRKILFVLTMLFTLPVMANEVFQGTTAAPKTIVDTFHNTTVQACEALTRANDKNERKDLYFSLLGRQLYFIYASVNTTWFYTQSIEIRDAHSKEITAFKTINQRHDVVRNFTHEEDVVPETDDRLVAATLLFSDVIRINGQYGHFDAEIDTNFRTCIRALLAAK